MHVFPASHRGPSLNCTYAGEAALMAARKLFGEILVDLRLLTAAQHERVVQAQLRCGGHKKFGQLARDMGLIREEHIFAALAVQMRLFPGIEQLSLRQVLLRLQTPMEMPVAAKVG
jgi:hypothetical protein